MKRVWKVCIHDLTAGSMYELQDGVQFTLYSSELEAVKAATNWARKYANKSQYEIRSNTGPKCLTIFKVNSHITYETTVEEIDDIEEKPVLIRGFLSEYVKLTKVPVKKSIEKTTTTVNTSSDKHMEIYVVSHNVPDITPAAEVQLSSVKASYGATSHLSQEIIERHKRMFPNFNY